MKHSLTHETAGFLAGLVIRHAITSLGLHQICPIRKCRRDSGCTGPILGHLINDKTCSFRLLDDRPPPPHHVIYPACYPGHKTSVISARLEHVYARFDENPDTLIEEPCKTIAARPWRTIGGIGR